MCSSAERLSPERIGKNMATRLSHLRQSYWTKATWLIVKDFSAFRFIWMVPPPPI